MSAGLIPRTLDMYVYDQTDWFGGWTIFYWGWWISWTPFVGVFVARISRGRTIREFLIGVTVVPTLFICLWMGVLGERAGVDWQSRRDRAGGGRAGEPRSRIVPLHGVSPGDKNTQRHFVADDRDFLCHLCRQWRHGVEHAQRQGRR